MGDRFQARSLAGILEDSVPRVKVWACSWHDQHFPFEEGQKKLQERFISNAPWVNRFDALVLGGGGLLSGRHRPLDSDKWVGRLKVPVSFWGVGATEETLELCGALVAKAERITVRDAGSMKASVAVRGDVGFMPDPILVDERHFPLKKSTSGKGFAFILRKVTGRKELLYKRLIADGARASDGFYCIFPVADKASGLEEILPRGRVCFTDDMDKLYQDLPQYEGVVSNRLHGCIVGLRAGIPTFGIDSVKDVEVSKIYQLYKLLGIPQFFINAYREVPSRADLYKLARGFEDVRDGLTRRLSELRQYTLHWAPHFFDSKVEFPKMDGKVE